MYIGALQMTMMMMMMMYKILSRRTPDSKHYSNFKRIQVKKISAKADHQTQKLPQLNTVIIPNTLPTYLYNLQMSTKIK